jgi:rubrerythrin
MAQLYREMAPKFPGKRQLLEGLSREEETHASMFTIIKGELFPAGTLTEADIEITLSQLARQATVIQGLIASLASSAFKEEEVIDAVLDLELSTAELQINRIVVENKNDPNLKLFVDILDSEQAHNRVLEEWRADPN